MDEIPDLKVAVEGVIHDAFAQVARMSYEQYGVRVNQVVIEWIDLSTYGQVQHVIQVVRMNTEKVIQSE